MQDGCGQGEHKLKHMQTQRRSHPMTRLHTQIKFAFSFQ